MDQQLKRDPLNLIDRAWQHVVLRQDLSIQDRWDAVIILDLAHVQAVRDAGRLKIFKPLKFRKSKKQS